MSTNTALPYQTKISLPYGELNSIIEWCQSNCEYNWQFDFSDDMHYNDKNLPEYRFEFESEKDYITFLVWKK